MWQTTAETPFDPEFKAKGDEIQKLSVIETLPQLLAEDAHSCITRVLPKIQQSLPTASAEFHMAAAVIFKQVLEQRLVSVFTFTEVFLQSILSSLESREPVISHAWLETILDVIELLPVEIIKREILPIAINEGQISKTVNSRITCCRLMGKISTRFDPASVKKDILPTVQTLCQDVNNDVRACICLQLRYVTQNVGEDIVKVLPSLVELTNDEESNVRQAAVQTIGHLLPQLQPDIIKDIIVPLIKIVYENAAKADDNVICVVAEEFGKLAQNCQNYLTPTDKTWFVKYYIQLAKMSTPSTSVEETKQDFSLSTVANIQTTDRAVECRRHCAFNIPAMFVSSTPEEINSLIPTFRNLANDSYFMVRRTIACSIHEVIKVLGSKSGLIKPELIRLLKDDNEEVLQGIIPHISEILELLLQNQLVGMDQSESTTTDLGRALMKCEAVISRTKNWRLSALMLSQLETVPKCFSSDFIYTYTVPVVTKRVLYSRPLPVRLAAGRTLLVLLRYNLKSQQKTEIRNQICTDFARGSSCYVRMVFIRMMVEAMSIFSSVYFKEHFCLVLMSLMEDPVANVRLKVVTLVPIIKSCLRLPADKKILSMLETNVRQLANSEKDRDVSAALADVSRQLETIEVRVDGQPSPTKLSKFDAEDMKKFEEEKKLETLIDIKTNTAIANLMKKPNILKLSSEARSPVGPDSPGRAKKPLGSGESPKSAIPPKPPMIRQSSLTTRNLPDVSKASTSNDGLTSNWSRYSSTNSQLIQPWERATTSSHTPNLTATNPTYQSSNEYAAQKLQCSCYDLADRIFRKQAFSSNLPEQSSYHSDPSHCSCLNGSNYIKTTSFFHTKHDTYRSPDFTKPPLLTSVRNDKLAIWQDLMLTRSSFASKYNVPEYDGFQSHYNPYWNFSSMPELPVTLVDDEFMVDAGIRIPSQLASSQSTSKIPNLQDIIYRNKKLSNSADRTRRPGPTFDKSKQFNYGMPKRFPDYEENGKLPPSSSSSHSSNSRESQYTSQSGVGDRSNPNGISSQSRSRFGYDENQRKPTDDKSKRNPILMDKDRGKQLQTKSILDRNRRHTTNYTIKLPETKESKLVQFKRHSIEVPDYNPDDRNSVSRTLRRFSTLDVNHNQGLSKIPVRNIHISGSRTAPVTRTSSPIRVDSEFLEKVGYTKTDSFSQDRRLRRFRSSDEEVDKLCQKF